MGVNTYHVGDLVRVQGIFKDTDDVLLDPTTVSLKVEDPSGNIDIYTYSASVVRDSEGTYHYDVSVDEAGDWSYWWVSTGTGQAAEPGQFKVAPTQF